MIETGDNGSKLTLARGPAYVVASSPIRPYDDDFIDFLVEVSGPGLSAEATVRSLGGDDLHTFLTGLAQDFAGWQGTRSWRSIENQLRIEADWGSRGHVTLTIRLRPRVYDVPWDLTTSTVVEAGAEMQQLAADVAAFFRV